MLFFRADLSGAHDAATSPLNDQRHPTFEQIQAGNYRKGRVRLHGFEISIENPKGSVRAGMDPQTKHIWLSKLHHHYGYIRGAVGRDKDHLDCFIGPHPESPRVFVVDQVTREGAFDEHKILFGFDSLEDARKGYLANYEPGWRCGPITETTVEGLRNWIREGDQKRPFGEQAFTKAARERKPVQRPGIHGGRFYVDGQGKIRYGEPPPVPFSPGHHEGESASSPPPGAGGAAGPPAPAHADVSEGVVSRDQVATITRKKSGMFAGRRIDHAGELAGVFRDIVDHDRERFWMVHLTERNKPLAVECVSQGSLAASIVHPRDTLKNALRLGTKAVAFVHNHPSGDPTPSRDDWAVTDRVTSVAEDLGIKVRHHVIVGSEGWLDATREAGAMPPQSWDAVPAVARQRNLPLVEGQIERRHRIQSDVPWADIFGQALVSSGNASEIGRRLLDPGDRTAVLLCLDHKLKVMGVFPLAHGTIDSETQRRAVNLAVGSGASSAVVVGGRDGPQWRAQFNARLHDSLKRTFEQAGLQYADTISVGTDRYKSMVDEGTLEWPDGPE